MSLTRKISWGRFSKKHKQYIKRGTRSTFCVAEGAVRAGKTIDNCIIAAAYLERTPDKFHLATGSTIANAKLNIGVCNGFGLEALFRGRCRWGAYRNNEALYIQTQTGEKIVVFSGGGKADSYKRILGNSYGLWIATEINEHYDCDDSRTSFIKVAMARQAAAQEPLTIWDLNPSSPHHRIYSEYIDRYREDALPGFLYEHFTIHDNKSMTPEQVEAFVARYRKDSVWYRRDILGQRIVAEGLIYRSFSDNPADWFISREDLRKKYHDGKKWTFRNIYVGVDFGGSGSAHTFVACAITNDWKLIALRSERIEAEGMNTEQLTERFLTFGKIITGEYGWIDVAYCDSAEQTIINSFRTRAPFPIANARKYEINDRIRATDIMMALHVLSIVPEDCKSLIIALSECVWDKQKPGQWVRLDDGTSDIDTLDAFEYSWERYNKILIREEKQK